MKEGNQSLRWICTNFIEFSLRQVLKPRAIITPHVGWIQTTYKGFIVIFKDLALIVIKGVYVFEVSLPLIRVFVIPSLIQTY
jgi:hypothetical protein